MRSLHRIVILGILLANAESVEQIKKGFFRNIWDNAREKLFKFESCKGYRATHLYKLRSDLQSKLYGQHIAQAAVMRHIQGFISDPKPQQPLVLSFHGTTGVGKNYVSKMIAEALFEKGLESRFVHLYLGPLHFPHQEYAKDYKMALQSDLREAIKACEQQIFIFDEIEKMAPEVLDVLTPFLEGYATYNGKSFRNTIFLLLSNIAGSTILTHTLRHMHEGGTREELTLTDMERLIINQAPQEQGGLRHSKMIEKQTISALIPFLPLTKEHVERCVQDDINRKMANLVRSRGVINLEEIINQLEFVSIAGDEQHGGQQLTVVTGRGDVPGECFAKYGCKRVTEKVDYVMYAHDEF